MTTRQEHLLIVPYEFLSRINYRKEKDSGNQPVARVVDRDWTGVFNEEGFFLGEEGGFVEVAQVGGGPLSLEVVTSFEEYRGCNLCQYLVG